jgi:hypothetical protein
MLSDNFSFDYLMISELIQPQFQKPKKKESDPTANSVMFYS